MNALFKFSRVFFLPVCLLLAACNKNIFKTKTTPHARYKDGLIQAGLQHTVMGSRWISAAELGLQRPVRINIPFKESGYFAPDKPEAVTYIFGIKKGEKLKVTAITNPAANARLFIELWEPARTGTTDKPLAIMDSTANTMLFTPESASDLILRVQPELLRGIEYTITLTTEPSLGYPVQQSGRPRLISPWGVGRDGGTRSHEGIDISATFRTPALAVADGIVTRVGENKLGGKVIFMRPSGSDYSVYYAHLDSQTVQAGQQVNTGDVVGLIGNTGNAQNTVPHLHFGIYTNTGAVDPLPFVDRNRAMPRDITGPVKNFDSWMRAQKPITVYDSPLNGQNLLQLKTGEAFRVLSANAGLYRIALPDGRQGFIDHTAATGNPVRKQKFRSDKKLLDAPEAAAPAITTVLANTEIEVKGTYNDFMLVKYKERLGWLQPGE